MTLRPGTHDVRGACALEAGGRWLEVHALRVTVGPKHATFVATVRGVTVDVPVPSVIHVLGEFGFLSGTLSAVDRRLGSDGQATVKLYASSHREK